MITSESTKSEQISHNLSLELSKLKPEILTKIINSASNGGRSLNALWATDITPMQKLILIYLGSKVNFTTSFSNIFESVSLSEIVNQTGAAKNTVLKVLKELCQLGYIERRVPPISLCITNHAASSYCLTPKAFDEYTLKLIEWNSINHDETKQRKSFYSLLHPLKSKIKKKNEEDSINDAGAVVEPEIPASSTTAPAPVQPLNQGWFSNCTWASSASANIFHILPNSSQSFLVCVKNSEIEKSEGDVRTKSAHIEKEMEEQKTEISLNANVVANDVNPVNDLNKTSLIVKNDKNLSKENVLEKLAQNRPIEKTVVAEVIKHRTIPSNENMRQKNEPLFNPLALSSHNFYQQAKFLGQPQNSKQKNYEFEKGLRSCQVKLSHAGCAVLRTKFISNEDCGEAIKAAMEKTGASLKEISYAIDGMLEHRFFTSRTISSMTNDLTKWINSKEEIIAAAQKIQEEQKVAQENYYKNKEEASKAENKTESIFEVKKVEAPQNKTIEELEKLPSSLQAWYKTLPSMNKRSFLFDMRKYGFDKFANYIIRSYQGYINFCKENGYSLDFLNANTQQYCQN